MENLRLGAKIGLKWVFIPFLIILVMSHNAGAINVMNDVNLIRGNMIYSFHCNDCSNQSMVIGSSGFNMIANNNQDLIAYVRSINIVLPSESYNNGDYLTLNMYVFNSLNNNSNDAVVKSFKTITNGWDLVDAEFSQISASSGMVNLTFRNYVAGTYTAIELSSSTSAIANLQYNEYLASGVATHWRPAAGVNYSSAIQNVVNAINSQPNYSTAINNVNNSINNLNSDVEDATQDAADAAQDAAEDNSSSSSTTNLVGVLSSFLQAITNFSATDCNVVLNFPSYAGGTMRFNVCQYKDKAGNLISVFTSLTLIVFYLPLAIKLLSMIYNEIRSFTNG